VLLIGKQNSYNKNVLLLRKRFGTMEKQKILIADDSEMNRALLAEILKEQYDVAEAENGAEAISLLSKQRADFSLLLLDIMMPEMDGLEVLACINKYHWNDTLAVIMISADDSPANIKRAYDLGAFDYISRPFDLTIVQRRISNTMFLYARQQRLEKIIAEQLQEQEKNNELMISILSHIVEFRNGESGLHILRVNTITKYLLKQLVQRTDQYFLSKADISLISTASALHDIGKISIPDTILNKPGRLTAEEFEIIKTHAMVGADMLSDLPIEQQEAPLVKVASEICRWHHERYDGNGYPDGLKGEEIPIAAQVVALADVYDALTSERCYKKAYSHEESLKMILEGQCGAFNPALLLCLEEIANLLESEFSFFDKNKDSTASSEREE
jgi:response regulator RpfG family c-di-GMP phosphodiesterase